MQTAAIDPAKGITYVDATLLADITAHYNAYHAAYTAVEAALSKRVGETAESVAAIETLKLFIRHIWTSIGNRAQRQQLSAGVFNYYQLNADGSRPTLDDTREAWIQLGKQIVAGDAQAVLAGFAAVAEPSALELQAVLDTAISETDDVVSADRDYDIAQANLAAFRAPADEMVADVRAAILYAARKMDAPSQRRILRTYGATYRYLPDEPIDPDDTNPEVGEPSA
jgi:hypothetical protein